MRTGFEAQIAANQRATIFVMGFMLLLLFGVTYAIGVLLGTPPTFTLLLAILVAGIYLLVTYNVSVAEVIRATQARPANPDVREEKLLMYKVEEMAIAAGLPVPKVYVQDSRDINAFATGLKPEDAIICMTVGALEMLAPDEMEGVLAHEMAHIANRDMRLATITIGVVGAIAMLAEIGLRLTFFSRGGNRKGHPALLVVALVAVIVAPIFSRLTYLFLSRKREYLADATGARFTRNPEGLARALEKIRGDVPDDPKGSRTAAGLYIANPWKRKQRSSMWSTHPPLDERIMRLRNM